MTKLYVAMFGALLAAVSIPAFAVADGCTAVGSETVCTWDQSYSYGGACSAGGYNYGYTDVYVYGASGFHYVDGYGYCYSNYYSGGGINAGGCGAEGCAFFGWYGFESGSFEYCDSYVYSDVTGYNSLGCPAGSPPNPGWGTLLP